jgi:hypothetical protein
MTNNTTHRNNYENRAHPRPFPNKELTAYKPGLAIQRIRFYLDVLEAHLAALGLVLPARKDPAPEEGRERTNEA